MRRDGNDCNVKFLWAVAPEYAVGVGCAVLNIGLEDLGVRIVGVLDRVVFVCLEARVARVCLEEFNALYDLLEEPFLLRGFGLPGLLAILKRFSGRLLEFMESLR